MPETKSTCETLTAFKQQLIQKKPLLGTFLKTPSGILAELMGMTQLDAICIDAEHAPFGRLELDTCILALRAAGMPSLVRVPSSAPPDLLNALDCGATGVVVPHVCSAKEAEEIVAAAHFGRGGRGYAGSTRAAGYTTKKMPEHKANSARDTVVIAQIEDIEALEVIDEIAQVPGIDCLFIGRIDLTVAMGSENPMDPKVIAAVEKVCAAGQQYGKAIGMFVPKVAEVEQWLQKGASLFLLASDHTFMLNGASRLRKEFDAM